MCIFSGDVRSVSATRIFARATDDGRPCLVYSMTVELDREVAMVLPVPIARGDARDDALTFIDLSGYPDLFEELDAGFAQPQAMSIGSLLGLKTRQPLVVHQVGAFVASYVPSIADLERLDARFRVPRAVFEAQSYADWAFAVFQLERAGAARTIHPMAFVFPTRRPGALFFPDAARPQGREGRADREVRSRVVLPAREATEDPAGTRRSCRSGSSRLPNVVARGVLDPDAPVHRQLHLHGELPNADHFGSSLAEPYSFSNHSTTA